MNKIGNLTLVVCILGAAWGVAQDEGPKGIQPAHPKLLFKALPKAVKGWKLTGSKGWMGEATWLESTVVRDFEEIVDPESKEPPGKTRLIVRDTGKFKGGELALFEDFAPKKNKRSEHLYLSGYPAVLSFKSNGKSVVQFLVRKRWILTISLENQKKKALKKWFDILKLSNLNEIKDGPMISRPDKILSVAINQLDGKSSEFASFRGSSEASESEIADVLAMDDDDEEPEE